ncbi:MAG: AAA family ATPase [Bdellovibrio sp.]|nr:MAG: AAA family ATPase [Bdellovibrio sp.]
MYNRMILPVLHRYLRSFPAVVLTGARQVGKTTLLKAALGKSHRYILLEDPDVRLHALSDPRGFLEQNKGPIIFDEFQYAPGLLSYLQGIIDGDRKKKGQFVLTGSQSFEMMTQVTQSLAGRAGILTLYGLCSVECPPMRDSWSISELAQAIFRGSYPELWGEIDILPTDWLGSYLRTYIERDLRNLTQIGDLAVFERFVRLCAIRTGQLLNVSDLGRDAGVSHSTAHRWLSVLEQAYLIHLIQPFYENLSSRIKKSPKLYFLDTGLAAFLMGFKTADAMLGAPQWGALFETWVISEWIKKNTAKGTLPEHCFLESKTGVGVDLMARSERKWDLFEIKASQTITEHLLLQVQKTAAMLGSRTGDQTLVAPVKERRDFKGIRIAPWQDI